MAIYHAAEAPSQRPRCPEGITDKFGKSRESSNMPVLLCSMSACSSASTVADSTCAPSTTASDTSSSKGSLSCASPSYLSAHSSVRSSSSSSPAASCYSSAASSCSSEAAATDFHDVDDDSDQASTNDVDGVGDVARSQDRSATNKEEGVEQPQRQQHLDEVEEKKEGEQPHDRPAPRLLRQLSNKLGERSSCCFEEEEEEEEENEGEELPEHIRSNVETLLEAMNAASQQINELENRVSKVHQRLSVRLESWKEERTQLHEAYGVAAVEHTATTLQAAECVEASRAAVWRAAEIGDEDLHSRSLKEFEEARQKHAEQQEDFAWHLGSGRRLREEVLPAVRQLQQRAGKLKDDHILLLQLWDRLAVAKRVYNQSLADLESLSEQIHEARKATTAH